MPRHCQTAPRALPAPAPAPVAARPAPWPAGALALALLLAAAPMSAAGETATGAGAGGDAPAPAAPQANAETLSARAVRKAPAKNRGESLWSRLNPFDDDKGRGGHKKRKDSRPAPKSNDSLLRKIERKVKGIELAEPGSTTYQTQKFDLKPEPTLSEEERAARREKAQAIEERLRQEGERVREAASGGAAGDVAFLGDVGADAMHPFAPEAVAALARDKSADSDAALLRVLHEGTPEAQRLALAALVARRHPGAAAAAREKLRADHPQLRQTAIMAAGELRDAKAAPELERLLMQAPPSTGVYAAAALLRIAPREDAREYLERTARNGAPDVAAAALSFLGMLPDARTAGLCFVALGSPSPRLAAAAARVLHRLPEKTVRPVLSSMPEDARSLAAARWRVADFLSAPAAPEGAGQAKGGGNADASLRAACRALLNAGGDADLDKAMACWEKRPEAGQLPLLVTLLTDPRLPLARRDRALFMLSDFLEKAGDDYAPPPEDLRDYEAWEKWWFRQHRLLAVAPGRALVQRPDGSAEAAVLQGTLDFSARVRSIAPGPGGPTALEGAKLEIACGNRRYLILP